jgi:hypothetical protein
MRVGDGQGAEVDGRDRLDPLGPGGRHPVAAVEPAVSQEQHRGEVLHRHADVVGQVAGVARVVLDRHHRERGDGDREHLEGGVVEVVSAEGVADEDLYVLGQVTKADNGRRRFLLCQGRLVVVECDQLGVDLAQSGP